MQKPPEQRPLYFIVGCPRSGTYLLSSILNAGGRIAIPTETHFVPLFLPYLWMVGDLRNLKARRRMLRAIFMFLRIWLARAEEERDFAAVSRHSLLAIENESSRIAEEATNYASLVGGLFNAYARRQGVMDAGDKSAFFDHMPLAQLDAAMGGCARFIHLIRDGRDVCVSWRKIKVGPRSVGEASRTWAHHIAGKQSWGRLHPDRYLEVRYELLLKSPRQTLKEVCTFIGFEYSDTLLEFHTAPYARDIGNSSTHARLSQPLDPINQGKWRQELTPAEVQEFEAIAGQALVASGYAPSVSPPPAGARPKHTTSPWSAHRIRLALKGLLPVCALGAAWLHLPLDRLCNSRVWLKTESWLARNRTLGKNSP